MLLKIGKMTTVCKKLLPSDEYISESRLPGGEYTGSLLVNPPWFLTLFSAAVFQRPVAGLFLTLFRLLGKDFIFRLLLCVGYIL